MFDSNTSRGTILPYVASSRTAFLLIIYPHTVLHYTTLHYTTLHHTALHYTTLHYTIPHYTTLHCTTLHYTALHCTPLHYITLHYTTLHYIALYCMYSPHYFYVLTCRMAACSFWLRPFRASWPSVAALEAWPMKPWAHTPADESMNSGKSEG